MNYRDTLNNENKLLIHGINNPFNGNNLSLNDDE